MVDGPPSEVGVEERLEALRKYRKHSESSHLLCDSSAEFDHQDAAWYIDPPCMDGSVMYHAIGDGFRVLSAIITSPPSTLRCMEKHVWTIHLDSIPGLILPITVDAAQDLLMVMARPSDSR